MDQSAVREIVQVKVRQLRWALQLQDWKIDVEYGALSSDGDSPRTMGECYADAEYRAARIVLDPHVLDNEEEVLDVLRHEMLHIFHAELKTYRSAVCQLLARDSFLAVDEILKLATETTVKRIEQMLDHGLGLEIPGMLAASEASSGVT